MPHLPGCDPAAAVLHYGARCGKGSEGISGHDPSLCSLAAVLLIAVELESESWKVGYAYALTINLKNC